MHLEINESAMFVAYDFDTSLNMRKVKRVFLHFRKKLEMMGSDVSHCGCMYCHSHLRIKIEEQHPAEYIQADLYPQQPG